MDLGLNLCAHLRVNMTVPAAGQSASQSSPSQFSSQFSPFLPLLAPYFSVVVAILKHELA